MADVMMMPCFALELEQDIALLEAEANRDELVCWPCPEFGAPVSSTTAACEAPADVAAAQPEGSDDVGAQKHQHADQQASDAESDDGSEEPIDGETARILANAKVVSECGKPLQAGGWRGCCKSPWCDREDRHRGLCNHRATIPGPAACEDSEEEEAEEEEAAHQQHRHSTDICHKVVDTDACGTPTHSSLTADQHHASAGGSSYLVTACLAAACEDKEVASMLQPAVCVPALPAASGDAAHEASEAASAAAPAEFMGTDLLWSGTDGGQLAATEQLLLLPAAYQPRVKDLVTPGSLLLGHLEAADDDSKDALCCDMEVDAAADDGGAAEQHAHVDAPGHSADTHDGVDGGAATNSNTTSDDSNATGTQSAAEVAAAASSPSTDSSSIIASAFAYSNKGAASQATPASSAPSTPSCASGAAAEAAVFAGFGAALVAEGSGVVSSMPPAAASPAASEQSTEAPEGDAAGQQPASAAPAAAAPAQRTPRVKTKPSNSMAKAAAAAAGMFEAACSPKVNKRRPCSRFATNCSGGGHCCTQCGAVSTPVWRAGPSGPKTLCNACGVRYMKVARRK